jgi:hypothetical protein
MAEEWRPIDWVDGIPEDKYEISSHGRIRCLYWEGIRDVMLPLNKNKEGYIIANLTNTTRMEDGYKKDKRTINKLVWVAKLVALAFVSPPPGINPHELQVYHTDGNISNNHSYNLEWRIGNSRNRMWKIEDRRRLLQIIVDNYELPHIKIVEIVRKELGIKVSTSTIDALLCHNPNGTMKSKQYELLGVDTTPLTLNYIPKLNEKIVRHICKLLCKYDGDIIKTQHELNSEGYPYNYNAIYRIRNQLSYVYISSEYFDYNKRKAIFKSFI